MKVPDNQDTKASEFAQLARKKRSSFLRESFALLGNTKKYWLLPLMLMLLALSALTMLSGSVIAPFIYTLF